MSDAMERAIDAGTKAIRSRFNDLAIGHLEFHTGLNAALAELGRCPNCDRFGVKHESESPYHTCLEEGCGPCPDCTDGKVPVVIYDGKVLDSQVQEPREIFAKLEIPRRRYVVARLDDE